MSCGCSTPSMSSYDGYSEEEEIPSFVPELNFNEIEDLEEDAGFTFNDDGEEFDDFLTKRARARRKLRRKLRKSGKSRKEARRLAKSKIPKQKLGALLKNAIKGKTSDETKRLIATAESGTPPPSPAPPISEEVSTGGTGGVPPTADGTTPIDAQGNPVQAGFIAKNKTMLIIAGVGVAVIGGYFLLRK